MKILFITPYDNNYRYKSTFSRSVTYMPLTMPYLAALTPEKYKAEIEALKEENLKLKEENIQKTICFKRKHLRMSLSCIRAVLS